MAAIREDGCSFFLILQFMELHYFNPENDMSLGLTPGQKLTLSPMVSRLHDDGALLPIWYASKGDSVLVEKAYDTTFFNRRCEEFGLDVHPAVHTDKAFGAPWGWSFESADKLLRAGADVLQRNLLKSIRLLSHRRTTIEILSNLSEKYDLPSFQVPVEATGISVVKDCLERWKDIYVKLPWSSSGRGVFRLSELTEISEKRISGMIRKQGSVLVEAAFNKKIDFAMLFHSQFGKTEFIGYSLFFNSRRDSYGGNLMTSDEKIENILIGSGTSKKYLETLKNAMVQVLTSVVSPIYNGYFGVDMMIGKDGSVSPCVELNLRMTMGVVAHIWRRRYLTDNAMALFSVKPVNSIADMKDEDAVIKECRLQRGRILLTPPSANGFMFSVETVEESEFEKFLI